MTPTIQPCVRSGHCCQIATCAIGVQHGASPRGCGYLQGNTPGEYSCSLLVERPHLRGAMAIGAGCSSTLFNAARMQVLRKNKDSLERTALFPKKG